MKRAMISLTQAVSEAGIDVVVEQLIAGKRRAFGLIRGRGTPKPIPPDDFRVPLRSPKAMLCIPDGRGNPHDDVPPDYVRLAGRGPQTIVYFPDTCLVPEEGMIQIDREPYWTDIMVEELPDRKSPSATAGGPKRQRIVEYLTEHFPDGVPDPAVRPRKQLRSDILKANPDFGRTLDEGTLKSAIDAYKASRT